MRCTKGRDRSKQISLVSEETLCAAQAKNKLFAARMDEDSGSKFKVNRTQ